MFESNQRGIDAMNRSGIFSLAFLAMLLPAPLAMAGWAPTQIEMATLPAYCAVKFDEANHPESAEMWRSTMGRGNFVHIHHYCAGLNFVNRARGMTSANKGRQGTLEGALRNFDYVLDHTQPDFYLRPGPRVSSAPNARKNCWYAGAGWENSWAVR